MRSGAWLVVLVAVAAGGCGNEPTLGANAAKDLEGRVAEVREAAGNGDRAKALGALEGLQQQVRSLQDAGSLADADATALRRGIGRTRARLEEEVPEPAPEPTPAPTAVPEPQSEEPGGGNDEQEGRGENEGPPEDRGEGDGDEEEGDD